MKRALPYAVVLALVLGLLATPRGVTLDHRLVERAVALDRSSPALDASMELGTALGGKPGFVAGLLLSAALGGAGVAVTAAVAAGALGATWMATTALKEITNRERPGGEHDRNNSSFPSGHASVAAAVAQVVSRRHRRLGPPVWALVAWIAASRVFLGHHYPSDVLAGLLLGVLIGTWALRFEGLLGRTAAADAAPPRAAPGSSLGG